MDDRMRLRNCLEYKATGLRITNLQRLRPVRDFLIDAHEAQWEGKELACRALDQLCEPDKQTVDKAICLGVLEFLDTVIGPMPATESERQQRLRDCIKVATDPGGYDQCREWADAWFD